MEIRRWKLPELCPERVKDLESRTGLSRIACEILAARGISGPEEASAFVRADMVFDDPFLLIDMDRAAERIRRAVEDGERIAVYGDYDCDGITATALLVSYFQNIGADVIYYIPGREKEGYGLNIPALDILRGQGVKLIVTVDNGVSAHAEIAYATNLGIDVVVTDHHTPRDTLPDAAAVVNPHRADCPSRFKDLAGVGVTFKLICALEQADASELLEYYSDLVTLGTIADVVPLKGENRIITRYGLSRLAETENPGIAALLAVSGLRERKVTSESAAFGIIPRINAAGRVGVADDVVELLLTDDPDAAAETAALVNEQNILRKKIEEDILVEIEGILSQNPQILNRRVLIAAGEGWHHGVLGIVASRLMERYGRPALLFAIEHGEARGSGRSVKGFSLIEAITACSAPLTRYGGHTLAAGLTLRAEDLERFCGMLQDYAREKYPVMPLPELSADCLLESAGLTVEAIGSLAALEPFGAGNEPPLFCLKGLRVEEFHSVGDGKHVRIRLSGGGNVFYAVWFGKSGADFPCKQGELADLMAKISVGEYNGRAQLSIKISDLRPADVPQEEILAGRERYAACLRGELTPGQCGEIMPDRDDIALVYRFLRRYGSVSHGPDDLFLRLKGGGADYCRMRLALDVLEELGLVRRSGKPGGDVYTVVPEAPRADLNASGILTRLRCAAAVS